VEVIGAATLEPKTDTLSMLDYATSSMWPLSKSNMSSSDLANSRTVPMTQSATGLVSNMGPSETSPVGGSDMSGECL
jgi:hypothetical protein